ncbi:3-oxoacyl-ACP reductase [Alicyclobacillus tengchongensis]|nr:3-oxoacyl-ACP reductase [Alicyclobacillus tengchongensis]
MSEQKVAIVTGASRGIGRAIAIALADAGHHVVVNYLGSAEAAAQAADLVAERGVRALVVKADVSQSEEAAKLVDTALEEFGRVDILINNAGITRDGLLMRMKDDDWNDVLNTNLRGAFYMTRQVARPMMKQRSGTIINITSVVGLMGNAGQVNYASAKAGLVGLTKASAKELAPRNITVNAIAPGYIETDMTAALGAEALDALLQHIPLARRGTPEDVANAVVFLASDKARYITGQVLAVDGGMVM